MLDRLRHTLRQSVEAAAPPPRRPNELRLDLVRAERQRRETAQGGYRPLLPASPTAEEARRAPPPAPTPPRKPRAPHPIASLRTRSGLRQAFLLNEILGPPRSIQGFGEE
jgi:hypothetical protein